VNLGVGVVRLPKVAFRWRKIPFRSSPWSDFFRDASYSKYSNTVYVLRKSRESFLQFVGRAKDFRWLAMNQHREKYTRDTLILLAAPCVDPEYKR